MSMQPSVAVPVEARVGVVIDEGPASKAGKAGVAFLALVAAVAAILNGDHSTETIMAGGGAVLVLVTYMAGRYAQAVAILHQARATVAATRIETPMKDATLGDV